MKHYNIPIFIPELACPNKCIYCNQRSISGQLEMPKNSEIIEKIESHLLSFKGEYNAEIAFFGGNFTGIELEKQIELLSLVQPFIKNRIKGIRISTRPDYINKESLETLKSFNVVAIELGAQSLCQDVLDFSKRGHSVEDIEKASKLINDYGFELGLQMMVGLPLDNMEKSIYTAKKIISLGAKTTRIYPCLVIENTELEEFYNQGKYKALELEEAISWVSKIYPLFIENNIEILRVGLHPSEALINKTSYLAGSFHVSFRELVLSKIWEENLCKIEANKDKKLVIYTNKKNINYAIGYNSKNRNILKERFKEVEFKTREDLKEFEWNFDLNS